ncbi:MAG: type II toxin-antitoxin system VapC family toxin [Nostoc sp. NMS7]|uniref:type II toxin-antitoxin system VapC family toxin n=1 Tax=Nostoc sp. NMS7 TaxID=2815391 RepID=UPI0025D0058F|nr:type II toxin-antitoxin system VapC family toxin [Nostoc sp. NMS7]MBN3951791.1 type II toxin-antitoxin system VapC family toxin [Nostoc sp. NMS7]
MVIDTMVFVYALLRVESQHEQALSALERAAQIIVPDSFFTELGNVVWQWIVFRQLPLTIGLEVLKDAESLVTKIIPIIDIRDTALELAVQKNHSFYDMVFVAAAIQEQVQVITFDRKFGEKFSERVQLLY